MEEKLLSRIDHIIGSGGIWGIDFDLGMQCLGEYLHEIDMAESGIKLKDFAAEREKNCLRILSSSDNHISELSRRDVEEIAPGSIAKLELSGVMRLHDGMSSMGTKSLEREINYAKSNPNVDGLLIEVSSGGGESVAGNHLHTVIKNFGKPVVAAVHYAGSAAYKSIVKADEIIGIGELSSVGSIGTMFSINKKMLEYIKNNFVELYSDLSPQKNKAFRDLLNDDTSGIKDDINRVAKIFQDTVVEGRKLNPDSKLTKDTLEGAMFLAQDAKKRNLLDQVGSMDLAISRLRSHISYKRKK